LAVQFIIGPAGSGKSTYVMDTVTAQLRSNRRKKMILLVPEQATFCYQYELVNQHGLSGVLTLELLSFQRLARNILQQTGGLASTMLDDFGKLLLLRRLLQVQPAQYPFFSRSADRPGYLLQIGQTFQEFKRCQITNTLLQDTIRQQALPETLFTCKLQELSQLYTQYEAASAQTYLDGEDVLELLIERLQQTDLLRDTEIWVDEFYDFTAQEYTILGLLMERAANLYIVLPADPQDHSMGRQTAFHSTGRTLRRLRDIAAERQVPVLSDHCMITSQRWQAQPDLAFLERQYFAIGNSHWNDAPQHLELWQGQNRLSEVDAVARKIRQLCRTAGYRYGEIGIFTRGDQYELLLETVLTDYEIPYFMDHKETVRQHPLTELLLAVFEILRSNWSYQSIFRFLKTPLLPFDQSAVDLLENYVLQYGIRGSAWYQEKDWHYGQLPEETLALFNLLRRQIAKPLRIVQQAMAEPQTADQFVRTLYRFLEDFTVPQQLEQLCQAAVEADLLETAQVHQQIWDKLIFIFDQMAQLLGDTLLSAEEFAVILKTAFDHLDLGLLPSSLDQVFVGALAHSRSRNLKVVFVLGLNEGVLPAKVEQNGFFNDREKQLLREMGLTLSPDSNEQLYDEQFLIYLALTRASQQLCLSYSLSDADGKALRPSSVVERLHRLYPALEEIAVQWPPRETQTILPYLNHPAKAVGLLGAHLTKAEPSETQQVWAGLYQWFVEHPTILFDRVRQSLTHREQLAQRQLNNTALYGSPLRLSVSALERYRQCPYSYFLTYGLRLQQRLQYKMEAVDVGQFYHAAIERFSSYLLEQKISWQQLDADQVRLFMGQIVEQLAPALQNEILLSTGRYRYLRHRLQKTLERSALFLLEHGQKGDFVPVALEADFGTSHSKLSQWTIQLQDGTQLRLQGRIDRVEAATRGDVRYLRVIDFKTGTQGFTLTDVYYGLKIQLLVYLQVALQYYQQLTPPGQTLLPAGVLYYFFRSGVIAADGPLDRDAAQMLHMHQMRANGLLVADLQALKLAERELHTGSSTLLPLSLLTKAAPYLEDPQAFDSLDDPLSLFRKGSAAVVTREQLELLLQHVQRLVRELGQQIHGGNIAVQPCRIGSFVGCQYCNYQAICQIQTVDLLQHSQELVALERDAIWHRLAQEATQEAQQEIREGGSLL